ncbi:hypothetical protein CVT24_003885 [Panaeolus cyanescens]|uniref:Uncharacterized protein n=1 Tax=Panaeolus cyanescens TaxID=181874 RepID=A0A409VV63_9AGAR|nr:hypothetical protein CVT24_003885 [Panaeolus cyanescens]
MHSRRSSSSLVLSASGSYDENKVNSAANGDISADHNRITMKTRVAVRDQTPHRFQVVPLRDVGQLLTTRRDTVNHLSVPSTPSNSVIKASCGRLNSGSCLPNPGLSLSSLPPSQQAHSANSTPKERRVSLKSSSKGNPANVETPFRRREMDKTQSVGETRPVLVELDLNSTPNRRSVKSDNLSHLSLRTNRRFVTIQQQLPSKVDTRSALASHTVNSETDIQSPGPRESSPCLLNNRLSGSNASVKAKADLSKTHFVKKVTFALSPRSSIDSDMDGLRSTKRHAIYTQSLIVPYLHGIGSPDRSSSEGSTPVNENIEVQGPPLLFKDEACDPLKNGDWLDYLEETGEQGEHDCVHASRKSLLGEPFELKSSGTERYIATAPKLCLRSETVAPLNFVLRSLDGTAYNGKRGDNWRADDIAYPDIILDLIADIDKAIESWR